MKAQMEGPGSEGIKLLLRQSLVSYVYIKNLVIDAKGSKILFQTTWTDGEPTYIGMIAKQWYLNFWIKAFSSANEVISVFFLSGSCSLVVKLCFGYVLETYLNWSPFCPLLAE